MKAYLDINEDEEGYFWEISNQQFTIVSYGSHKSRKAAFMAGARFAEKYLHMDIEEGKELHG